MVQGTNPNRTEPIKFKVVWQIKQLLTRTEKKKRPYTLYEETICNFCGRIFQSKLYCILHLKNDHHEKVSITQRIIR